MPKIRKDNKGRNLRPGETQRSDGSYMFVYKLGKKKKYIYDSDLAALRVKEKQLTKDADDGIRTQEAMKITLNDRLSCRNSCYDIQRKCRFTLTGIALEHRQLPERYIGIP